MCPVSDANFANNLNGNTNNVKSTPSTRITVTAEDLELLAEFADKASTAAIQRLFSPETIGGDAEELRALTSRAARVSALQAKLDLALDRLREEQPTPEAEA